MSTSSPEQLRTFIFGAAAQSAGPLALGVGRDSTEAMQDAVDRLLARSEPSHLRAEPMAGLVTLLQQGQAAEIRSVVGGYPKTAQLGHAYMTNDTQMVAVCVGSDPEARALVLACGGAPDQVRTALSTPRWRRAFGNVELGLVDWSEVAGECEEEVMNEASEPAPAVTPRTLIRETAAPTLHSLLGDRAGRKIEPDVLAVLSQCTVSGQNVYLPATRLDRKLYAQVNEVLMALGGKWVGRKVQAHVFEEDPAAVLDVAVGTGTFVKPQDFGYFPTPAALVERLLALAGLEPGMKVLEPEAGTGAIALPAARIVGFDLVTPIELLPGNARKLREAGFSFVNEMDFLTVDPVPIFDRILMNPPFANMADVEHVMHATRFLKPDGVLASIMSPSWGSHSSRKAASFRDFVAECDGEVQEIERGAFREAGTDIATRMVLLEAANMPWNRRERERQRA
jgi:ubiquinone/menaquinone biosynthesis C-methylase UbiE